MLRAEANLRIILAGCSNLYERPQVAGFLAAALQPLSRVSYFRACKSVVCMEEIGCCSYRTLFHIQTDTPDPSSWTLCRHSCSSGTWISPGVVSNMQAWQPRRT